MPAHRPCWPPSTGWRCPRGAGPTRTRVGWCGFHAAEFIEGKQSSCPAHPFLNKDRRPARRQSDQDCDGQHGQRKNQQSKQRHGNIKEPLGRRYTPEARQWVFHAQPTCRPGQVLFGRTRYPAHWGRYRFRRVLTARRASLRAAASVHIGSAAWVHSPPSICEIPKALVEIRKTRWSQLDACCEPPGRHFT